MPTIVIKFSYEPVLEYYKDCEIDGKLVETPLEAARFDLLQLYDGAMGVDDFFVDRDISIEVFE